MGTLLKILVVVLIVYLIFYGLGQEKGSADEGAEEDYTDGIEEMQQCPECKIYVPAIKPKKCDNKNCPF